MAKADQTNGSAAGSLNSVFPMKSLRLLLALAIAGLFANAVAQAADDKAKTEEKTCDCGKDKDGKVCGKDKDCCCTGKKCETSSEKPVDKKEEKK